jgi:lipoyl(octanoyl) transferase
MGRKAEESDILAPESELTGTGVSIHRINRGGETTYHGPGQVVGYAIINLYNHQRQLRKFVDRMEQVFIDLLDAEYGIAAHSDADHRGVWVGSDKIAAIGIAVTRGITMHGFAFNVMPDLSHFDWIIPCGIRDRGVTSLEKLTGQPVAMDTTMRLVGSYFASTYGYEASWAD